MKHRALFPLPLLFPLAAVLTLGACSSDPAQKFNFTGTGGSSTGTGQMTTSTSAGGGSATSSGATGTGGGDISCVGPGYKDPNPPELAIGKVTATIVDLAGNPVPDKLPGQVCGTDECLTGVTANMTGAVTVIANKTLVKPAFKYGDARTFAKLLIPVKAGDTAFGTLTTAALPVNGVDIAVGTPLVSGDVTIEIPKGGAFQVDFVNYPDPIDQQLRTVTIPVDKVPLVVTGGGAIALLYGIAPADTVFCPPAKVTVPNTALAELPAGADVEFLILDVETFEDWGPYGAWQKVSDGKVSADGKTITTTEGLPVLHLFGIRKKP
jgi:hypothetical protein